MRSLMIALVLTLAFVTFLRDLGAASGAETSSVPPPRTQISLSLLP